MPDSTALAVREAERYATDDPTYAELMGVYAQLNEALAEGRWEDCPEYVGRLVKLGAVVEAESDAQWAAWRAREGRGD